MNTAIKYLQQSPNTKVIASGGQGKGEDISEAECMTRLLKEAGISVDRIIQEDKSTTTVENIQFSYSKITEDKAKIGIVTSNFHVARAVATAKAQGDFSVYGIAAPFTGGLLPHYMIREFLAFTVDGMWGHLF